MIHPQSSRPINITQWVLTIDPSTLYSPHHPQATKAIHQNDSAAWTTNMIWGEINMIWAKKHDMRRNKHDMRRNKHDMSKKTWYEQKNMIWAKKTWYEEKQTWYEQNTMIYEENHLLKTKLSHIWCCAGNVRKVSEFKFCNIFQTILWIFNIFKIFVCCTIYDIECCLDR